MILVYSDEVTDVACRGRVSDTRQACAVPSFVSKHDAWIA